MKLTVCPYAMNEPRQIDVLYGGGHWLTELDVGFLSFDCSTLMQLIEAVRREYPDQSLLFVVDYSTIAYYPDAKAQVIEASEKSGALVIASVLEF
jgi:hypothetical protein